MPGIDAVMRMLKTNIANAIAPYQPNIPPLYPNPDPRAGSILPTLVARGHPIQYHVLARLENHSAQIAIWDDGKGERVFSYVDRTIPTLSSALPSGAFTSYYETGRSIKGVCIEIWTPAIEHREVLSDVVRAFMSDAYRQTEVDGTITLFRYREIHDVDTQEKDTVYVRQFWYDADFVITEQTQTVEVEATKLGLTIDLPDEGVAE